MQEKAAGLVDNNTIAIVGVAGTTEYGMVDPIADLAKIAQQHDLFFHVDAAFGGMVIPFLDRPVPFDFALPGVSTIAVDPHKMGMSTIPCGCLLTREPGLLDTLNIDTPYLTVKQEYTLGGTRPGAPVAGALAVLDYLGTDGMKAVVRGCMKNTMRLIAGMKTLGYIAGRDSGCQRRDICLPTRRCAGALEGLVDLPEAPADRLHAPCARGQDRGIFTGYW